MSRHAAKLIATMVGGIVSLWAAHAFALSTDREQPIQIEANNLDVDDIKGVSIYHGNVVYTQGSIVLKADELIIHTTEQRDLSRVEAKGKPARFRQLLDNQKGELRGHAQYIEYQINDEQVLFTGSAYFWQCGDEFSGNRIEYDAQQEVVKASRAASGEERVQVILQPRPQDKQDGPRPCVSDEVTLE